MAKKVTVSGKKGTLKSSKKAKVKTHGADLKNPVDAVNEVDGVLEYKINALHFLPILNEDSASYKY